MHAHRGPSGQWYNHNGDFSGEVLASLRVHGQGLPPGDRASASIPHKAVGEDGEMGEFVEVRISFEDIRSLYLAYVRQNRISRLEQAENAELEAELLR